MTEKESDQRHPIRGVVTFSVFLLLACSDSG